MKVDTFAQQNDSSALLPVTHTIAVKDEAGRPIPEPATLDLTANVGETVVWKSDNGRQFYVNFSPFSTHLSGLEDGRQTIILPVVTEFSFDKLVYELGYVDTASGFSSEARNSSSGIITCSTCSGGDAR